MVERVSRRSPSRERDFRVLIAVERRSFQRLIEHVLHGHPGLLVLNEASKHALSARRAGRLAPDVIIVSSRISGSEPEGLLAALRASSPASTLILLTHVSCRSRTAADACLHEEAVVTRLLPTIQRATHRMRNRVPLPALAGSRT
jgi:DNA-binding NarL/FixJ family response regulator